MSPKRVITFILVIISIFFGQAQIIPVEIMIGNEEYRYQHFFGKKIKQDSHFGFFHTHSMYHFFDEAKSLELMSQSYLTYELHRSVKAAIGTFYATVPGFKPSGAIQFTLIRDHFFLLAVPRIDITSNPSYEVMTLMEYRPPIIGKLNLYSRLQLLANYDHYKHNRSYQNLRIGIGIRFTQLGIAFNIDEYGSELKTETSWGVFLRHELAK